MEIRKMKVNWIRYENNKWCNFEKLNLPHNHFNNLDGVYIIWSNDIVVRVGSGNIKGRISDHRNDVEINGYPALNVTWAKVSQTEMLGVERYLGEKLNPAVGDRFPNEPSIPVNLPWD